MIRRLRNLTAVLTALGLASCASQLTPPSQPSPASIASTQTALAAITGDPVSAWEAGDYAVRAACHAYLNEMASREANISLAGGALGIAGPAASGFLLTGGNPVGAVAASAFAALGQSLLAQYNSSGAIPYTTATAGIIENAIDAYEAAIDALPPATIAEAASYVDDEWFTCSPGGYAMLVTKAIGTAQVTAAPATPPAAMSASPAFAARAGARVAGGRPKIEVNGE